MSYASEVSADSPYVYLKLNETSGTVAADSSGNARDGTYVNAPTLGVAGLVPTSSDLAVQLTRASSRYLTVPDDNGLDGLSAFTVEAWIQPITTLSSVQIAARDGQTANRSFQFGIQSAKLQFIRIPGSIVTANSATTLVSGTTYHVAAVYNGTDIRLYVNGALDGTPAACTGSMGTSAEDLRIGARRNATPTTTDFFNGVVDEFAVYTTALSAARIAAHYAAGTSAAATVTAVAATATAAGVVPAVSAGSSVAPPAATATAAALAPTVGSAANATVTAVAATATALAAVPTVAASSTVSPSAASATAAALPPSVSAGATVASVAATATAVALPPTVSTVTPDATVSAVAATATAAALPPTVAWSANLSAVAATATAAALIPTVSAGATVAAVRATATALAKVPSVSNGSPDATVTPDAATALAAALAPTITVIYSSGTDTSNGLNGRRRRARASVTVLYPAGTTPSRAAVRYDKSVPLPPPTLVDGRPT